MDYLKKITKKIFQYEARLVLKKYKPKIIAITGSVGKTITKEAIYLVLSKKFFVRKSEKSFTAELGVPLTIIGCSFGVATPVQIIKNLLFGLRLIFYKNKYPEWLILEMDSDKPGDLVGISSLISIDILIVTAIGDIPSHVESFFDVGNFLAEKKSIINAVKRDGVIIYNADDLQVENLVQNVTVEKISCGTSKNCAVFGSKFKILYDNKHIPIGMYFDVVFDSIKNPITILGSAGVHNEYACLLAFATGLKFQVSTNDIVSSLCKYKSLPGRMNLIPGIKDTIIIDDTYNSSPVAVSQAISVIDSLKCKGKKIVVLGDMLELGKYSADEHRKIAGLLKDTVSVVICVGFRMRKLAEELYDLGFNEPNIISVDYAEEAGIELQKILEVGDVALIKGSQAMRMERVVEEVMRYPENKEKVLVRQGEEWVRR